MFSLGSPRDPALEASTEGYVALRLLLPISGMPCTNMCLLQISASNWAILDCSYILGRCASNYYTMVRPIAIPTRLQTQYVRPHIREAILTITCNSPIRSYPPVPHD